MSLCACIGPAGDCPCIRTARGQKVEIYETQISKDLFALLSDEDKMIINRLKFKALALSLSDKNDKGYKNDYSSSTSE